MQWPQLSAHQQQTLSNGPEILYTPHLDDEMATPMAMCRSSNLMEAQSQLVGMVRSRINAFRVVEVIQSASLDNKGKVVVKEEPLMTNPMWCVCLKVLPLDAPHLRPFQMDVVPPETLTLASLCAAVRRGLSRGTARMRSSTTLRSPCKVLIRTSLQAVAKRMWEITVKVPAHFAFTTLTSTDIRSGDVIEKRTWYKKMKPAWTLVVKTARNTKGVDLWEVVQENAYETIEGGLEDDWDEKCWHIDSLFHGNHYDVRLPLYSLDMHDGCTIHVVNQKNHKWTIFFKCPDGSIAHTYIFVNDTAASLHRKIVRLVSEKMPIPASEMYTSYSSKLLEYSNAKVWELGMHNGSTVIVNVRLRGGVCVPYSGNLKRKKNQVMII